MTLNGVMAVTLRYFNEFGKHAFQLITAFSSIEHIDQKSVKLVYVTKVTHSRVDNTCKSVDALHSFNLSSKFHFTVAFDAWLPVDLYAFAL